MSDNSSKWYYQPSTGTVFQGKKTGWDDQMGPYDSKKEARAAMEKVVGRNKATDDRNEEDDGWGAAEK